MTPYTRVRKDNGQPQWLPEFFAPFTAGANQRITNGLPVLTPVLIHTLFICRYS